MEIEIVSLAQFNDLKNKGKVLVDFYATWCGPCMMLSPIIEGIVEKHPELTVLKVDVDSNRELAMQYGVSSIPNLLLFENGELKGNELGYMPEPKLLSFLGY